MQHFHLLIFLILFNSAPHVSGEKFSHPQEHFSTVYTAFGYSAPILLPTGTTVEMELNSISTVAPVGSSIGVLYPNAVYTVKKCS